ncbi:hypothetical protein ABK040_009769 [Willaertia magna]
MLGKELHYYQNNNKIKRERERFGIVTNNTLKYNSDIEHKLQTHHGILHVTINDNNNKSYYNNNDNNDNLVQTIPYSLNKHKRWELLDHHSNNNHIEFEKDVINNRQCSNININNNKEENLTKKERKEKNKLNKQLNFEKQLNKNKYQLKKEKEELKKSKEKNTIVLKENKEEQDNEIKVRVKKQTRDPYTSFSYYYSKYSNVVDENAKEGDVEIYLPPNREEIFKRNQLRNGEYNYDKERYGDNKVTKTTKKEKFVASIFL